MTYKKVIDQKIKEFEIHEYIKNNLKGVGHSHTKLIMTPLGEKILVYASRPGMIVGRKGQSIKKLTISLKKRFNLENPQIEINEVDNINIDAQIVAEKIANTLERFGSTRFKAIGHKAMENAMYAGALGIEILMSGKIPSTRAKRWRFYQGYLKKSGDTAATGIRVAYAAAQLKSGTIGVQVRIMPPDIMLPDDIRIKKEEEIAANVAEEKKQEEESKDENKNQAKEKRKVRKKQAKEKNEKMKRAPKKKKGHNETEAKEAEIKETTEEMKETEVKEAEMKETTEEMKETEVKK